MRRQLPSSFGLHSYAALLLLHCTTITWASPSVRFYENKWGNLRTTNLFCWAFKDMNQYTIISWGFYRFTFLSAETISSAVLSSTDTFISRTVLCEKYYSWKDSSDLFTTLSLDSVPLPFLFPKKFSYDQLPLIIFNFPFLTVSSATFIFLCLFFFPLSVIQSYLGLPVCVIFFSFHMKIPSSLHKIKC